MIKPTFVFKRPLYRANSARTMKVRTVHYLAALRIAIGARTFTCSKFAARGKGTYLSGIQ
jgi:hypothetical protein